MKVKLLHITPLEILVKAIRICYNSWDKSDSYYEKEFKLGNKDKTLIERVIASKHHSVLEHLNITFDLSEYSRSLLQQKSRHRIGIAVSEQSTRYCLKKILKETAITKENASKYLVQTGIEALDNIAINSLNELRQALIDNPELKNDDAKLSLPESFKSKCITTFNFRAFRNWLELRTDKHAHWEIRQLAFAMYNIVPNEYKFLLSDCIKSEYDNR